MSEVGFLELPTSALGTRPEYLIYAPKHEVLGNYTVFPRWIALRRFAVFARRL